MSFPRTLAIAFLVSAAFAFGQQGPSPLIGKKIHVYNPEPGGPLNVDMSGTGHPMTAGADNWMHFTVPATIQNHIKSFGVRNDYGQGNFWITRTGMANGGADAFTLTDFGAGNEVWIIIDPSGPSTAAPSILTEAPKVVNVFNPWPTTAPVLALTGGTKKGMRTIAGNCGWFTAFLLKPSEHAFYLEEVNGADAYGSGGLGNRTPYNLTPEFAKGPTLWLDTDINTWLATDPKKNRPCGYQMAATVRDFSQSHVDFDFGQAPDQVATGMVQDVLPANKKPARTAKTHPQFNSFDDWFNTKAGVNAETCVDIPMTQSDNGMWMYDSYLTPDRGFYPIDNFTTAGGAPNPHNQKNVASCYVKPDGTSWVTGGPMHNLNFCMESHATFIYQKGQRFEFRGDDDVWVYINNKLVIDLGGLHTPKSDTVELDQLGLTPGQTYNWDFYYCERQPCGSSLKVKTSIYFKQQRSLEAVPDPAKPGAFKIVKYSGGTGACGSLGDEVKEVPVPPGSLVYKLWNVSGTELETLGEGSFHAGGIVINTPSVMVDTAKIVDLPPGQYRVVAYEAASQGVRAEVPFTIRNRSWVQFEAGQDTVVTIGAVVPVVAANRLGDAVPAGVASYAFAVLPASGLRIFNDAGGTVPAPALSRSTKADGLDTLWVSGDPAATSDVTYTLSIPNSTRSVKVTFKLPPLILPRVASASVHDDDADGIADRIVAVYDTAITGNLPREVAYRWPASAAPVTTPGAALGGLLTAGTTLTLSGKPLGAGVLTGGAGQFLSTYPARGRDSTQAVPLADRIAPVLLKAEMHSGTTGDTLRLVFSEPVNVGALSAPAGDLFVFRLNQAGADLRYPPSALAWTADGTGADLVYAAGAADSPRSGNLIRLADGPGRIADAAGNGPGPNSRFRLITGLKKADVNTVTFMKVDPVLALQNPSPVVVSVEPSNAKVEEVVARKGRLGHLIKVDLGDHAQSDDFTPVDPAKVFLEYQVAYFTNHGVPVASEKKTLSCLDALFQGDCRANRGYVFVGWNFNTLAGQRVATGAYVARLKYKVTVAGKSPVNGGLDQVWGVLRSH